MKIIAKGLTFEYYFYTFGVPFEEGSEQCRDATRQRQKGGTLNKGLTLSREFEKIGFPGFFWFRSW